MAQVLVVVLCLTALCLAVLALYGLVRSRGRAHQRRALQRRFGPEYDRAVEETGSGTAARRELRARTRRVARLPLRDLGEGERARFREAFRDVEAWFVDDPTNALQGCERLVDEILRARGYPSEAFAQRLADLSVHHAHVVDDYRRAHDVMQRGRATPERWREAFQRYRVLLTELIEASPDRERARTSATEPRNFSTPIRHG